MPNIQVLEPHLADLIAAGEVVERPASVAKELMENAIDAGASSVTVEIAHGGMAFLRVTDDGCGIPAGQLQTAFLRHATSKLRTERDLEAIGTLGFRGEALAAISAVSRVEVMTRTAGAELGASLVLDGGVPGDVEEAGCPVGTTLVVRDLFYNTPARLKFLKKDAAEGAAVFAAVQRLALSHPEVAVKFIRDGKQELMTPGDGNLQSVMYAVLGRDLALGFIPVNGTGDQMSVDGYVSQPTCCRGSRNYQHFFVNGRNVKSKTMLAALEQAYQNQKMVGKFPGCVLHLTMRLGSVDVNVHPAKTEVKFGSDRQVFDAVYHAVLAALERDRTRPAAAVEGGRFQDTAAPKQRSVTIPEPPRQASRLAVHDFSYQKDPAPAAVPRIWGARPNIPAAPRPPQPSPGGKRAEQILDGDRAGRTAAGAAPEAAAPPPEEIESQRAAAPLSGAGQAQPPESTPWRMVGEVLSTYIIVEQGDSVLLIDKHAAHERMNFDRMKAAGYSPMVQALLVPAVLRPQAEELEALLSHLALLEEFGFVAEEFGGGALVVRQAPFDVAPEDIEPTLLEIAGRLLTTGTADPSSARDEVLHTMACKSAIKGGWRTSPQELERVAQAVMSGAVKYCPHGRPVAVELTKQQLEKQFKRT